MIDFEFGTSGKPVDTEYVRDVESEIGVPFPSSFIDFMKRNSGGIPGEVF